MSQALLHAATLRLDGNPGRGKTPAARELFCPFAPAIHPDADAVNAATVAWARAQGLVDERAARHLESSRIGSLVARAYPGPCSDTAGAREALQLAADWTTFFCLLDDAIERLDSPSAVGRALGDVHRAMRGDLIASADGPLVLAAAEIGARLDRLASGPQRARVDQRVSELFEAFIFEAEVRSGARPLPLAAYVPLREITVGIHVEVELGEIVEGRSLTPDARLAVERAGLLRSASNLVGWANDVHTYEKEIREGEVNNLVVVLAEAERLDLGGAVARAIAMHDAEMHGFVARSAEHMANPDLVHYVLMLRRWVRGHLDWARETGRYRP